MEDGWFSVYFYSFFLPHEAKQIMVAALIGFVIGLERAWRGKQASMRTFATICCGSCLFTVLSIEAAGGSEALPHDVTRIAAQIVTGIGFLGGGVIFKSSDRVEGITTGALVWLTAAIGMGCGFNQMAIVVWTCLVGVLIHLLSSICYWILSFRKIAPAVLRPEQ